MNDDHLVIVVPTHCPFCNAKAIQMKNLATKEENKRIVFIECLVCAACGPIILADTDKDDIQHVKQNAIKLWNCRFM